MQTTPMNFKNGVTIAVLLLIIFFSVGKISKQVQTLVGSGNNLAQVTTIPAVPTGLTAVAGACGGQINLSWNAVTGASYYELIKYPGAVVVKLEKKSYTDTGLTPKKVYEYSVRAVNNIGASAYAKQVNPTASDACAPSTTPTLTLSASPTSITSGSSSTLTWSSTNATSCTASGAWSGTQSTSGTSTVSPTATSTYTLNCTGAGGSVSKSATVTVTTPAPTVSLSASPASINSGASSTLTWSSTNATSCTASGDWSGSKATSGTLSVTPTADATYTLDCTGAGGSASKSASVTVLIPPTLTLSASPASVLKGASSTLTWSSTNATSCTASGAWSGTQSTSGTSTVSPTATSTYTLNCTGAGGSVSKSATVTVTTTSAATVNLSASPLSISAGQSSTLNWSSANVSSCVASKGWTGAQANSGTLVVTPSATTTYTLTCTDAAGKAIAKSVTVSIVPTAGPITLPALPLIFQVPMPTQTGKVWTVAAGDSTGFQSALNQAQLGDTIELAAGSTYTGNFTFPKKNSGSGWIVVRSDKHASLPGLGVRVAPSDASNMPKLVSPSTSSTIMFAPGSHHYRLIGLEVTEAISTKYIQTAIVAIWPASGNVADLPNNITLDRMYIHSQPTTGVQRCVHADGAYVAIIDSYLGECHAKGFDSQAIAAWNTNGPIKIVNNMLEGAGENIMFGGADPLIQGASPSDIEVRGNYIYTPVAWKGTLVSPGNGQSLWSKKNLFELKTGSRILVEGNVLDGSWGDAQVGHAFVIKSANQGGKCVWCQTKDVTIRYNIVRNVGGTGGVSGTSGSNNNKLGGLTSRVLYEHNYFENINVGPYNGVGRLIELYNNAPDVTYRNNTWNNSSGGTIQHYISAGSAPTATNFTYMDNIAPFGQYGVVPGFSEATLAAAMGGTFNYSGNVVYGKASGYSATKYPKTPLAPDYATALTIGKGANMSLVNSATAKAILGK